MTRIARRRLHLLVAMLVLAASCSNGSDDTSADAAPPESTLAPTTEPPSTTTQPPAPEPIELEVLTYNVAGLPDSLSGSEPATNTELIGPLLNGYDLVLVQESWLSPEVPLPDLRTYHEILLEIADHAYASTPLPAPMGSDADRPSALLSDGIEVDVYNLHMDAGRVDADVRGQNVAELTEFVVRESAERAVIVGGDFNLHLDRDPDAEQFASLLIDTGLTDVCTALGCDDPNRIDKVLFRSGGGIEVTPVGWRNDNATFTRADGEPLSDHEPVVATLRVSAR